MGVAEQAQGSGLNSKMVASQELATCAAQLGRRSGHRPGLIGAAQQPEFGRRTIIPAAFQFHCETARYYTACL
jgi:hypothetical protein